ncbi:MAG: rod shape-determining protein MreC [Bryobacteraceae bacterium]
MEFFLSRYRNLSVLVAAILAQLVLLAYQVRTHGDVRLIRVWAVGAVTPMARVIETSRSGVSHFFSDYFVLLDVRDDNKRMKAELDRVKMENQYLRTELSTADRAHSLAIFQEHSPSKTVAAHIIGNDTGVGTKEVFIDRGSNSGIAPGMAVITPDGIAGKVVRVFSTVAQVLLVTDANFAAGVISQNNRVHGTFKGQGYDGVGKIEHVQNEQKVDQGEWFYTSGDDRIFPKGRPVGEVTTVRQGKTEKEIYISLSGFKNGFEEVLIIVEGVHAPIPDAPVTDQGVHLLAPPPPDSGGPLTVAQPLQTGPVSTDADRIKERYRKFGEQTNHVYGERSNGAPNYNAPAKPEPKP